MNEDIPRTPFALKAIRTILIVSITAPFAIIILGWAVFTVVVTLKGWEWQRLDKAAYEATGVGDTWAEVEKTFGRPSDHTCRFQTLQFCYYIDRGRYSMSPDATYMYTLADRAVRKDEIPVSLGAKQYLVQDGVVIAHAWIGEDQYIHYSGGKLEGHSLKDLPDELFASIADP